MAKYKLEVTTGDRVCAGTFDYVYVTLIGTKGRSKRTELDNFGVDFSAGKTGSYVVKTKPLGRLLLLKVEKDPTIVLPEDEWFCAKITVTTPEDEVVLFPCHRWVSRGEYVELRGGKAMKANDDDHPLLIEHRKKELELRRELFQWSEMADGLFYISCFKDQSELPAEHCFSKSKGIEFVYSSNMALAVLDLQGMRTCKDQWESLEHMKKVLWFQKSPIADYVMEHWMEDDFYGYQFLNGVNPTVIQRCSELPSNFVVTEEMIQPFLEDGSCLHKEMKKGNIFLCDYKLMEGVPTRVILGEPQHFTPALCLFYLNSENQLKPIAIQLGQQPSEQNPIFLPSDAEPDWLLAKMFVKNADTIHHQVVAHLMKTHFLAEVFALATLRNFPVIHPLYKLLIPHFRYTLQINTAAREKLLGPHGLLTQITIGEEGLCEIMRRSLSVTTFSSLCLPDNIAERGLEEIPNFYYRDDGLKLWNAIYSFVKAMVEHYYPTDHEISKDPELQRWINDIFTKGFMGNCSSGIPEFFNTAEEVVKFITMVIFTASAQHAAVNSGQFDFSSWFPNNPLMLRKPPATSKGQATMKTILETLPVVMDTVGHIVATWILSKKYADLVPLGSYPEERFDELKTRQIIKNFQAELSDINDTISKRNSNLKLPYNYLKPAEVENSVSL